MRKMGEGWKSFGKTGICEMTKIEQEIRLVVTGHVDHGKSTIIGRLLVDTNSLPDGKLASVKEFCERKSKKFEYAFLLDALHEEQTQGITIDSARIFFHSNKRRYLIIDTPGHIEFLRNMVTGASQADAALLVIDSKEGIRENSKRHAFLLGLLGIKEIVIIVNKMDLVGYKEEVFSKIKEEFTQYLSNLQINPLNFIPTSGIEGDNISERSENMIWYEGPTLLEQLDLFGSIKPTSKKPLRIPVQDVYKFTNKGDDRRIIAGRIESGSLSVGDQISFYPSGKTSTIISIEGFGNKDVNMTAETGESIGFKLKEQLFINRGEIATSSSSQKPETSSRITARIFWIGKKPLINGKKYLFKLATSKVEMIVKEVVRVVDTSTLSEIDEDQISRNKIGDCVLEFEKIIAFDTAKNFPETGRFVIVDDYEICGGGIILESLPDRNQWVHERAIKRNERWEFIQISDEMRIERYKQKSCMVLISGSPENLARKELAKELTEKLFNEGKFVYFIGMANLLYGVDADIRDKGDEVRPEHMRRLAEIGNLMMHAGLILVVSAREISNSDIRLLKTSLADRGDRLITAWVGGELTTDLDPDIYLKKYSVDSWKSITKHLIEKKYIFGFVL